MKNIKMYCLCLKNDSLNLVKSLNYIPVGLGESNFSNELILIENFFAILFF